MRKFVTCCLLLLSFIPIILFCQEPTRPGKLSQFIPKGFEILDSASGDLNRDVYKDLVLILKNRLEEKNGDLARPLLLLVRNAGGDLRLLSRNDSVVMCKSCGGIMGDPYQSIAIKNGYFSIEHYGGSNWRWTRIITFKYDPKSKTFLLHKDAGVSYHSSNPDKQENIITNKKDFGSLRFEKFSNTKEY